MFITSVRAWGLEERRKQTGEKEEKYIKAGLTYIP